MAYQRTDPTPFIPMGFNRAVIPGRDHKVRAVLHRQPSVHEDWTIVTIEPMPLNNIPFENVYEAVREFVVDHIGLRLREIQRSSLGQALVQFENVFDRDNLVEGSPHNYADVRFRFVRHNQGQNWRRLDFNRECWLLLMGFPLDYWHSGCIQSAISAFGRVINWENDQRNLTRLVVKAKVLDLERVPQFTVVTDAEDFHGHSWTVQCEVIQ